jgi:hypothetical protein
MIAVAMEKQKIITNYKVGDGACLLGNMVGLVSSFWAWGKRCNESQHQRA